MKTQHPRRSLQPLVSWLSKIFTMFIVWILFCWAADFVFHLGADPWRMVFGYVAGGISLKISDLVGNDNQHTNHIKGTQQ